MTIFRGNTIRGNQIKERSIEGSQLANNTIINDHIAHDAAIDESKLNINWHAHTEILQDRKVIDYVQANNIEISGTGINLSEAIPEISEISVAKSNDKVEGIITDKLKNIAPIRDSITGEPIVAKIDDIDYEVIARVEHDGTNYLLNFYTISGEDGAEVPYDLGNSSITIDMQYARRFNLENIDEMFAANEKFVHGAADITSHLNTQQLAKDIYGDDWSLNRDGNAKLSVSIIDQIDQEKLRSQLAETTLQSNIDDEIEARKSGDEALQNKIDVINSDDSQVGSIDYKIKHQVLDVLSSNLEGEGSSTIGIKPIDGMDGVNNVQDALEYLKTNAGDSLTQFEEDILSTNKDKGASLVGVDSESGLNGTNVQEVLEDHEGRLLSIEQTGGAEVVEARTSTITGEHETLNQRLKSAEERYELVKDEVDSSRGNLQSLNERLSVSIDSDGYLVDYDKLHEHRKYTHIVSEQQSIINLPEGEFFNINSVSGNGVITKNSAQVYINGILQSNGINFLEVADELDATKGIAIDFSPEELIVGDLVVIEWVVNNVK